MMHGRTCGRILSEMSRSFGYTPRYRIRVGTSLLNCKHPPTGADRASTHARPAIDNGSDGRYGPATPRSGTYSSTIVPLPSLSNISNASRIRARNVTMSLTAPLPAAAPDRPTVTDAICTVHVSVPYSMQRPTGTRPNRKRGRGVGRDRGLAPTTGEPVFEDKHPSWQVCVCASLAVAVVKGRDA